MTETIVEFGPERRLVGVLCRPDADAPTPLKSVAVVITNSGIIHRVGANRLHVRLARLLAAHGYASLRYDLPGIGDSETLGGHDVEQDNLRATTAAFDTLQAMNVARAFVMIGLCSGAGHGFSIAAIDHRVVGATLIDPPAMFSTWRHRMNRKLYAAARALRPRALWKLVTGRAQILRRLRPSQPVQPRYGFPVDLQSTQDDGMRQQVLAAMRTLVQRKVKLFLIVTGHNEAVYSYRRQMFDAFPELPELDSIMRVDRRPSTSHTFGSEAHRRALEADLLDWLANAGLQAP